MPMLSCIERTGRQRHSDDQVMIPEGFLGAKSFEPGCGKSDAAHPVVEEHPARNAAAALRWARASEPRSEGRS